MSLPIDHKTWEDVARTANEYGIDLSDTLPADMPFWPLFLEALDRSRFLCLDRISTYNRVSIQELWINGFDDLLYELNKKLQRLRGQLGEGRSSTADKVEDGIVDMISYAAFLYAYHKLRTQEEK